MKRKINQTTNSGNVLSKEELLALKGGTGNNGEPIDPPMEKKNSQI